MIVYRLGRTKYASDLSGEGPRLFGGRWNHKGISCIYASETRALALLEYTVNVNMENIPRALSMISIEIPEKVIRELKVENLLGNWRQMAAPSSIKNFGTGLLRGMEAPIFKIPSSIIIEEFNFLLNPDHAKSKDFKIIEITDFVFDIRIKLK